MNKNENGKEIKGDNSTKKNGVNRHNNAETQTFSGGFGLNLVHIPREKKIDDGYLI